MALPFETLLTYAYFIINNEVILNRKAYFISLWFENKHVNGLMDHNNDNNDIDC